MLKQYLSRLEACGSQEFSSLERVDSVHKNEANSVVFPSRFP